MTKDEFYHKANERTVYEGPTIWCLVIDRLKTDEGKHDFPETRYGHVDAEVYYFPDLQSCENQIAECVKFEAERRHTLEPMQYREQIKGIHDVDWNIYAFHVYQLPLCCKLQNYKQSVYERVYDKNGKFLDESLCANEIGGDDDWIDKEINRYYGRPSEKIRFKPGDMVEYGRYVGVVASTKGMDINFNHELHERLSNSQLLTFPDYSDDSYLIIDDKEGGHAHVHACEIFPLQLPIPHYDLVKLEELSELAKTYDSRMAANRLKGKYIEAWKRRQPKSFIHLSEKILFRKFDLFNKRYFKDKLQRPSGFEFRSTPFIFASVNVNMKDGRFTNLKMTFSTAFNWDEWLLDKTLIHEMIHIEECQDAGHRVKELHGPTFRQRMIELNETYGLNIFIGEPEEINNYYLKPRFRKIPKFILKRWPRFRYRFAEMSAVIISKFIKSDR